MKINLHIERVVLDGVPVTSHDRALFSSALETELTRLLRTDGIASHFAAGGAIPSVSASPIELGSGPTPGQAGRQIAGAVYSAVGGNNADLRPAGRKMRHEILKND